MSRPESRLRPVRSPDALTVTPGRVEAPAFSLSHEYVAERGATPMEEFERSFDAILGIVERFRPIDAGTAIYEVGAGLGWFEVICAKRGLQCSAIEPNPVVRAAALELAARHSVEVDIRLASIETVDLEREAYDVVIAASVFEHVRNYGLGLANIYQALRPGGVLYVSSTNKFSPRSGEFPDFPLYGWFPYSVRRRIRVSRQGPDIVRSSGIDFNQFTYRGLSMHLRSLGFSQVLDRYEYLPLERLGPRKALAMRAIRASRGLRFLARTCDTGTRFIGVK
jgi:SAM-dependent methyltransferase